MNTTQYSHGRITVKAVTTCNDDNRVRKILRETLEESKGKRLDDLEKDIVQNLKEKDILVAGTMLIIR